MERIPFKIEIFKAINDSFLIKADIFRSFRPIPSLLTSISSPSLSSSSTSTFSYTFFSSSHIRFAQLLTIEMHPLKPTVYFVGTGEGCLHECSIFDPYQHKRFMHVHKYGIYFMEFSPWSPKIFLTCGVDWYVFDRYVYIPFLLCRCFVVAVIDGLFFFRSCCCCCRFTHIEFK